VLFSYHLRCAHNYIFGGIEGFHQESDANGSDSALLRSASQQHNGPPFRWTNESKRYKKKAEGKVAFWRHLPRESACSTKSAAERFSKF